MPDFLKNDFNNLENKPDIKRMQSEIDSKVPLDMLGKANGIAQLDGNGKLDLAQFQGTTTVDTQIQFSENIDPFEHRPTGSYDDIGWSDAATAKSKWIRIRKLRNDKPVAIAGYPDGWTYSAIKGETGDELFNSLVFKISPLNPGYPVGGTFKFPVPNGWSDGIPESLNEGDILWMSMKRMSKTGDNDGSWTIPKIMVTQPAMGKMINSVKNGDGSVTYTLDGQSITVRDGSSPKLPQLTTLPKANPNDLQKYRLDILDADGNIVDSLIFNDGQKPALGIDYSIGDTKNVEFIFSNASTAPDVTLNASNGTFNYSATWKDDPVGLDASKPIYMSRVTAIRSNNNSVWSLDGTWTPPKRWNGKDGESVAQIKNANGSITYTLNGQSITVQDGTSAKLPRLITIPKGNPTDTQMYRLETLDDVGNVVDTLTFSDGQKPALGIDYSLGDTKNVEFVFSNVNSACDVTINPADGTYNYTANWKDDAYTLDDTKDIFMSKCTGTRDNTTGVWSKSTWTLPKRWNGKDGIDGKTVSSVTNPNGSITYTLDGQSITVQDGTSAKLPVLTALPRPDLSKPQKYRLTTYDNDGNEVDHIDFSDGAKPMLGVDYIVSDTERVEFIFSNTTSTPNVTLNTTTGTFTYTSQWKDDAHTLNNTTAIYASKAVIVRNVVSGVWSYKLNWTVPVRWNGLKGADGTKGDKGDVGPAGPAGVSATLDENRDEMAKVLGFVDYDDMVGRNGGKVGFFGDVAGKSVLNTNLILADSIVASKIKANTLTSREINVDNLFAQNITATGTISGAKLKGGEIVSGNYYQLDSNGRKCNDKIKQHIYMYGKYNYSKNTASSITHTIKTGKIGIPVLYKNSPNTGTMRFKNSSQEIYINMTSIGEIKAHSNQGKDINIRPYMRIEIDGVLKKRAMLWNGVSTIVSPTQDERLSEVYVAHQTVVCPDLLPFNVKSTVVSNMYTHLHDTPNSVAISIEMDPSISIGTSYTGSYISIQMEYEIKEIQSMGSTGTVVITVPERRGYWEVDNTI